MALDPAWIALAGTICGGVGLKVAEHWLGRNRVRADDATQIRDELRTEITTQREEIKQLEKSVDDWKREYYDLRDKYIQLQTELTLALQKITSEAVAAHEVAKSAIEQSPPPNIPVPATDTVGP